MKRRRWRGCLQAHTWIYMFVMFRNATQPTSNHENSKRDSQQNNNSQQFHEMNGKKENYIIIPYFSAPFSNSNRIENMYKFASVRVSVEFVYLVIFGQKTRKTFRKIQFYNLNEISLALPMISSYKDFSSGRFWTIE